MNTIQAHQNQTDDVCHDEEYECRGVMPMIIMMLVMLMLLLLWLPLLLMIIKMRMG
ncbi:hypothetical protein DPMN_173009 [Dreissena polymorpha]|uniref:Transmembrane protein n=1 Tax=Dreissena polymorpha TaxID=45954 RepID=A0A9D4IGK0_DREPO|nr:hypothetical protein DPMN_173009 [Dreissena polymorpha]